MDLLTINILVKDENKYLELFSNEIHEEIKKNKLNIQICGIKNREFKNKYNHVNFIECDSDNEFEMYEKSLSQTSSKFVVFFDENVVISRNLIRQLSTYLKRSKKDVVALHLSFVKMASLELKEIESKVLKKQKYVDYLSNVINPLYFCRYVFNTQYLKSKSSHLENHLYYKDEIILNFLNDYSQVKLLEQAFLATSEPMENNHNSYSSQFEKSWYFEYFSDFLIPYAKNHALSPQMQKMMLYMIQLRFYMNLNGRDKFVLKRKEVAQFFDIVKQLLQYIDDECILQSRETSIIPKGFAYLFMKIKHPNELLESSCNRMNNYTNYYVNQHYLGQDCVEASITAINYENERLIIDCELMGDYLLKNIETDFHVMINGIECDAKKTNLYNITKAFGCSMNRFYTCQFEINKKDFSKKLEIEFKVELDGTSFLIPISFAKTSSRLIESKASYFTFDQYMITVGENKLILKHKNILEVFVKEIALTFKTLKMRNSFKDGVVGALLRVWYWITRGKYKNQRIWIFFDKLYKAGDNAEYLFDYCYRNAKECQSYYVINKTSIDYTRLKEKYGENIVEYNSLRHKILVLNSSIIFATHASVMAFCGFGNTLQKCFRNLLKTNVVCIQHGLTIQNIAQYQNRLADNTKMYFCASKYEIDNLKHSIYGYDPSNLYLSGSPRYDGLINRDQRQILIAPTWRRNIVITGNAVGTAKEYNPNFKHTTYFKLFNHLINDSRLLEEAKKYNYRLVFLIHPTLSSQLEDFDKNEFLTIIPAVSDISYEKILTESSLMVTDYSGIQFDFAYMKKPILYYHPDELPPQYNEGIYKYDTMGFGPIITKYDSIIESLCDMMKHECVIDDIYEQRVNDFFKYTDHRNCERIYKIVKDSSLW